MAWIVSPYGLDSTSRVAIMFVFCKLDHRGIPQDFAVLLLSYAYKGHGPPKILLGIHGPPVGNHWARYCALNKAAGNH